MVRRNWNLDLFENTIIVEISIFIKKIHDKFSSYQKSLSYFINFKLCTMTFTSFGIIKTTVKS